MFFHFLIEIYRIILDFYRMEIVQRIYNYLEHKSITAYEFERSVGLSNGYLNSRKNGTRGIGSEILEKIYRTYPDLNLIWLVTGDGNMEVSPLQTEAKVQAHSASPSASPFNKNAALEENGKHDNIDLGNTSYTIRLLEDQVGTLKASNADKDEIIQLLKLQLKGNKSSGK